MHYQREQIRNALALSNPALSSYLDLQTGDVVQIDDTSTEAAQVELRDQVMMAYGERYRYISGGNAGATDADVQSWMDQEGL